MHRRDFVGCCLRTWLVVVGSTILNSRFPWENTEVQVQCKLRICSVYILYLLRKRPTCQPHNRLNCNFKSRSWMRNEGTSTIDGLCVLCRAAYRTRAPIEYEYRASICVIRCKQMADLIVCVFFSALFIARWYINYTLCLNTLSALFANVQLTHSHTSVPPALVSTASPLCNRLCERALGHSYVIRPIHQYVSFACDRTSARFGAHTLACKRLTVHLCYAITI